MSARRSLRRGGGGAMPGSLAAGAPGWRRARRGQAGRAGWRRGRAGGGGRPAAGGGAGRRFDVRMGGGDAVEAALSYALIVRVLTGEAKLAPPDVPGDVPAASRFYATLRQIRQAAAGRPLLLALDDVHWADPDSLTFLHLLCRRGPAVPPAGLAGGPAGAPPPPTPRPRRAPAPRAGR